MNESEFHALRAQGYNRIPLSTQAFADLETPLSLYLKLARADGATEPAANSFLLESVVGGERFGRYSFIGLPARTLLRDRLARHGRLRAVLFLASGLFLLAGQGLGVAPAALGVALFAQPLLRGLLARPPGAG